MSCTEARELLHAFADGELDAVHHTKLEAHFAGCPACSAALEQILALRDSLAGARLSFEVPARLEASVRTALRKADGAHRAPERARLPFVRVLRGAALLAAGVLLGFMLRGSVVTEEPLVRDVVENHVRSLMVNHLADVESTDQHTVKPWFVGKLDFAPQVHDFAGAGFLLVGGRLDYLEGRPVAALVYKRRQHVINLFEWQAPGASDELGSRPATRQGYTVFRWTRAGTGYAVVSDLATSELEEFVRLASQP